MALVHLRRHFEPTPDLARSTSTALAPPRPSLSQPASSQDASSLLDAPSTPEVCAGGSFWQTMDASTPGDATSQGALRASPARAPQDSSVTPPSMPHPSTFRQKPAAGPYSLQSAAQDVRSGSPASAGKTAPTAAGPAAGASRVGTDSRTEMEAKFDSLY